MAKICNVLGLMSGTSMDGIDVALLRTDGYDYVEPLAHMYVPYSSDVQALLRSVLGCTHDVTEASRVVTDWHVRAVQDFLKTHDCPVDLIGFHGQTILHNPKEGVTVQIGDGPRLARETGIDVVYDFRMADVKAGGQGAPLLPLYHRARIKALLQKSENEETVIPAKAGIQSFSSLLDADFRRHDDVHLIFEPVCVLNLGGVANITWIKGDDVVACDTGPANALIDDWMLKKTGKAIDKDGAMALQGTPDVRRVHEWLAHPFFAFPAPKSLDRNAFYDCSVDDLSLEDGAATLAAFTVQSVLAGLRLMPEMPECLIVAGGGRHNRAVMQGLAKAVRVVNADDLGWNGDGLEAEGFAYLAQRSRLGLPLSLPSTTGCHGPTTGGVFHVLP